MVFLFNGKEANMKYSPKKIDTAVRAIYAALIIFSVIAITKTDGPAGIILRSISIITLSISLYLFIRYEMTTYTYILNERGTDFDFIINKCVGRRGNYVCYCYMSDCVLFEKRTKNIKKFLRENYKGIGIYNFSQNIIKKNDYVIVFLTEGKYDAIFFEPNEDFAKILADAKANAKPYTESENYDEFTEGDTEDPTQNDSIDIDKQEAEEQGIEYEEKNFPPDN